MRGLLLFLIIVFGIISFSLITTSVDNKLQIKEETKNLEFSTFTSAVCEHKADVVYCKDELFVNCYGEISKAVDVAECNGIKLDIPKATGFAIFRSDWKDPRI